MQSKTNSFYLFTMTQSNLQLRNSFQLTIKRKLKERKTPTLIFIGRTKYPEHFLKKHFLSPLFPSRGVEPYDLPTTVLVQRSEPQGSSTILSSTDFFQSERNRRVILEQVDSFQLREKYMFATTTQVRAL